MNRPLIRYVVRQTETFIEGDWVLSERIENNTSVACRYRLSPTDDCQIQLAPYLLVVHWMREEGAESEHLLLFEDAIERMQETALGHLMMVSASSAQYEWSWYVHQPQPWLAHFRLLLKGHPVFPIEIRQTRDPEWSTWKRLRYGAA